MPILRQRLASETTNRPRPNASIHVESRLLFFAEQFDMARWPDDRKANLIALALVFALFPLLCWLSWQWLNSP